MKIIILNESKAPDPLNNVEKRCAATPSSAQRLVKKGATLLLEAGRAYTQDIQIKNTKM